MYILFPNYKIPYNTKSLKGQYLKFNISKVEILNDILYKGWKLLENELYKIVLS